MQAEIAALIQFFSDVAVRASTMSPCRSKRGAVVFRGDRNLAEGYNFKPRGFECDGSDACKATCRSEAIHAEQSAILNAGARAYGADLLHVKSIDGRLVPSGGPSCVQCSKLALVAGIAGVWLYHESGWQRYDAPEFHRLSLLADLARVEDEKPCDRAPFPADPVRPLAVPPVDESEEFDPDRRVKVPTKQVWVTPPRILGPVVDGEPAPAGRGAEPPALETTERTYVVPQAPVAEVGRVYLLKGLARDYRTVVLECLGCGGIWPHHADDCQQKYDGRRERFLSLLSDAEKWKDRALEAEQRSGGVALPPQQTKMFFFRHEAERIIEAIAPTAGATMTLMCALRDAFEAGRNGMQPEPFFPVPPSPEAPHD